MLQLSSPKPTSTSPPNSRTTRAAILKQKKESAWTTDESVVPISPPTELVTVDVEPDDADSKMEDDDGVGSTGDVEVAEEGVSYNPPHSSDSHSSDSHSSELPTIAPEDEEIQRELLATEGSASESPRSIVRQPTEPLGSPPSIQDSLPPEVADQVQAADSSVNLQDDITHDSTNQTSDTSSNPPPSGNVGTNVQAVPDAPTALTSQAQVNGSRHQTPTRNFTPPTTQFEGATSPKLPSDLDPDQVISGEPAEIQVESQKNIPDESIKRPDQPEMQLSMSCSPPIVPASSIHLSSLPLHDNELDTFNPDNSFDHPSSLSTLYHDTPFDPSYSNRDPLNFSSAIPDYTPSATHLPYNDPQAMAFDAADSAMSVDGMATPTLPVLQVSPDADGTVDGPSSSFAQHTSPLNTVTAISSSPSVPQNLLSPNSSSHALHPPHPMDLSSVSPIGRGLRLSPSWAPPRTESQPNGALPDAPSNVVGSIGPPITTSPQPVAPNMSTGDGSPSPTYESSPSSSKSALTSGSISRAGHGRRESSHSAFNPPLAVGSLAVAPSIIRSEEPEERETPMPYGSDEQLESKTPGETGEGAQDGHPSGESVPAEASERDQSMGAEATNEGTVTVTSSPSAAPLANGDPPHSKQTPILPSTPVPLGEKLLSNDNTKAGIVLELNQELFRICMAYTNEPEIQPYRERLGQNLNWLEKIADKSNNMQLPFPILQPPKPLPPTPQAASCKTSLQRVPALYARMQAVFKGDVERRMRRDQKAKMRISGAANGYDGSTSMNGSGGRASSSSSTHGAGSPTNSDMMQMTAGVKREGPELESVDRKRMATGMGMEMSGGVGSPLGHTSGGTPRPNMRPPSVVQSPHIAGMTPAASAAGSPMAVSTPQMMTTPSLAQQQLPNQHHQSPPMSQQFTSTVQPQPQQQTSPSHSQMQNQTPSFHQMQPSGPGSNQHQHQMQMAALQHQMQQQQQQQQTMLSGGNQPRMPSQTPQQPPNLSPAQMQQQAALAQAQRSQGMNMNMINMNGPSRSSSSDDLQQQQRNMQLQNQMRQHQANQAQILQQMQQNSGNGFGNGSGGQMNPVAMAQQQMNPNMPPSQQQPQQPQPPTQQPPQMTQNMIQPIIQALSNASHPMTQQLHKMIPNFGQLPPQVQVQHFQKFQTQLQRQQQMQNQAFQQQQQLQQQQNQQASTSVLRPPSAVGQNQQVNIPPGLASLRRGTASPRIPGSNPSGMPPPSQTPLQRIPSSGFNPSSGGAPQQHNIPQHNPMQNMNAQHLQNMTPQQRQFVMQQQAQQQQQQQRAMFPGAVSAASSPGGSSMEPPPVPIRASSLSRATQSPTDAGSPSNQQTSFNIGPPHTQSNQSQHSAGGGGGISPINTMMASRAHSQQQQPGMGWSGNPGSAGPSGYVGSPLNPSWSPQTMSNNPQHHSAATSPLSGGGGYGIGTSPARSHSDATPHHPGTPVNMQHQQQMLGNYDIGSGEYSGGSDPSALFNEWTTGGSHTMG